MSFSRISIIGLGLIGGSVAMAIRARLSDCRIMGYDADPQATADAIATGAIHQSAASAGKACEGADCVIVCVPLGGFEMILEAISDHLKPGTIVTDVCSTKRTVVAIASRLLARGVHFVGSHPMAGRELSGFAAARADLFNDALCITTTTDQTDRSALEKIEALWRSLGARTTRFSPGEHDYWVAQISHVPHVLASAMMNAVSDVALRIAGPGFRDITRVAAGDPELWRQILEDNAPEVRDALRRVREELDAVEAMLEGRNGSALKSWLTAAADRRRALPIDGGRSAAT
jgi:prephenate dehydrogenase